MLLTIMIVVLIVFSLIGMEIAWAIGLASIAYVLLSGNVPLVQMAQGMTEGVDQFVLVGIPLFILAGELMNKAGVTQRLIAVASAFVGHLHGGLANVGVWANFIMSGISGSSLADAAATGTVLVPEMTRRGFPPAFSSAVIACASTVGPIIPPSIVFVLLGAIVDVSIGRLFIGGLLPGFIMSLLMFFATWWISRRRNFPREPKATFTERRVAVWEGTAALLAPVIIVGSIVGGVATPTEGAAVAVAYVLFLGLVVYRNLTFSQILEAAGTTALASSVIMLTVATSWIFAQLAVLAQLGVILTAAMTAISSEPWVLLLLFNILMLILGMVMEIVPILLILAPIMFRMFTGFGYDPVHLGVMMVLNLMIGMITPPIGLNLFVLSAISRVSIMAIFREAIPYFVVLVFVLGLITYVPWITLALPNLIIPAR